MASQSTQKQKSVIDIHVVNYELVHARDAVEIQKLVDTCRPPPHGLGFFFLDLSGPSTKQAMLDVAEINTSTRAYFNEHPEVKMKDFLQGIDRGFKPSDKIETFEISTDEEARGSLNLPAALQSSSDQISRVLSTWDAVTRDVVSILCSSIDPTGKIHSPSTIRGPSYSESGLKLCLMNNSIPVGEESGGSHTDSGLLTLMYYDAASLELAVTGASGDTEWSYPLQPVDDCAIVNVGDSLQAMAGGRLHSHVHRSVQPDGDGRGVCYPLYFLRPQHT